MKLEIFFIFLFLSCEVQNIIVKSPKTTKSRYLRESESHIYSNPIAVDLLVAATLIYFLIGSGNNLEWALVLFSLPFILKVSNDIIVKKFHHGDGRNLKTQNRSLQRYIKKIYKKKKYNMNEAKKDVVSFLKIHDFEKNKVGPIKLAKIVIQYFSEVKGIKNKPLTKNIKSVVNQLFKKKKDLWKLAQRFIS